MAEPRLRYRLAFLHPDDHNAESFEELTDWINDVADDGYRLHTACGASDCTVFVMEDEDR